MKSKKKPLHSNLELDRPGYDVPPEPRLVGHGCSLLIIAVCNFQRFSNRNFVGASEPILS